MHLFCFRARYNPYCLYAANHQQILTNSPKKDSVNKHRKQIIPTVLIGIIELMSIVLVKNTNFKNRKDKKRQKQNKNRKAKNVTVKTENF